MASVVTAQLLFLEAEAPDKPLSMYINSPGGSVTAGLAMYDTMQYIRCDVHTIAMGQAASMGSLLLAGGSPGCRKALPHASIMLHQPSGGAQGMVCTVPTRNLLASERFLGSVVASHRCRRVDLGHTDNLSLDHFLLLARRCCWMISRLCFRFHQS